MQSSADGLTGAGSLVESAPAVDIRGITKRFGPVTACDGVDLTLRRGRIHGILGENGAGKSTLMKMLIGLVLPDEGSICIDGVPQQIHSPLAAASLGIGMVHQHFSLVDALTVWENVALGEAGRLNPASIRNRIGEIADHYGLIIDPDARVGGLTAGLRQRVEIIKCLRRDPSILVFDEPTSVLTPEESVQLFSSLRQVVTEEGRAVVLVSHKLDEVLHATDDISIMRQGKVVDRLLAGDTDAPTLARGMVGRDVSLRSESAALGVLVIDEDGAKALDSNASPDAVPAVSSPPVLTIDRATLRGPGGTPVLDDFSLELHPGEIVGVAGVEGNGQRELGDLLSSLVSLNSGSVAIEGTRVPDGRSGAMAKAGIGVIPEDRHDSGIVLDMTLAENLILVDQSRVSTGGVINQVELDDFAKEMISQFGIHCSGPDAPMWSLSGGNQQRVVLARELAQHPKVLVAAQPTRGLDVGAIEYMGDRLKSAAADGVAVLLISSELEEILDLSHRIVVMHAGRIVGGMDRANVSLESLGLMMGGVAQ
ncbi:ABC transporter ATP-binding protein [bacterium]|jgi:general nucleoside transport system ATP-binding protein|nr:ABC transporter ATP-binding protein [bacterium]